MKSKKASQLQAMKDKKVAGHGNAPLMEVGKMKSVPKKKGKKIAHKIY